MIYNCKWRYSQLFYMRGLQQANGHWSAMQIAALIEVAMPRNSCNWLIYGFRNEYGLICKSYNHLNFQFDNRMCMGWSNDALMYVPCKAKLDPTMRVIYAICQIPTVEDKDQQQYKVPLLHLRIFLYPLSVFCLSVSNCAEPRHHNNQVTNALGDGIFGRSCYGAAKDDGYDIKWNSLNLTDFFLTMEGLPR